MMSTENEEKEAKELLSNLPDSLTAKDRAKIPHQDMPSQKPGERIHNMKEVALGYTEDEAVLESQRCLNCKNKP